MARYTFDVTRKIFTKTCSCCKEEVVGTSSVQESLAIFQAHFSPAGPSSGMADGMQSRCNICNIRSRRDLGVSRSEVENMLAAQNGRCAICGEKISIAKSAAHKDKANVDHDGDTGVVRELLCGSCNRGLGLFYHDAWRLTKAVEYLRKHNRVVPFRRRI